MKLDGRRTSDNVNDRRGKIPGGAKHRWVSAD